jgi:predicted dehydrogenase
MIGIGVVGFGWMGRVHAQAYGRVRHHFPDAPRPEFLAVADDVPGRAEAAAELFGFATATDDWRRLLTDPLIQAVSITAPNFLHREMGAAFAKAGKHIWIEKPVGLTADDARAIVGDVQVTVGFNYRNAPAVEKAREILKNGEIGVPTHARIRFLSDYAAHPEGALSWRFESSRGGNGVLGDLGSHGVDLIRHLLGEIESLIADTAIFIPERPRPLAATEGHQRGGGAAGRVENDDYLGCLIKMTSGARVTLDCSRVAVGEQNSYGFEIHGTRGALYWDFRRMGELGLSSGTSYQDEPVRTIHVGPHDGEFGSFQPGAGIPMSFDDLKVIEAYRFLRSIADDKPYGATLADAIRSADVLDAMTRSVQTRSWVTL